MAVQRNLQRTTQSRVFLIEDRASPAHAPNYQTLARMTGLSWSLGDVTPVRVPDPRQYGKFITVDKIQGQPDLPSTTLEYRMTRGLSEILRMAKKGCQLDVQLHVGACKDPSDFDLGWEKVGVFENVNITNYSTDDLGAMDGDQNADVMETVDITADDYYELRPLAFSAQAESQIVQSVVGVAICDTRACGACGIPSDGCQKVFTLQLSAGASPGVAAEVVFTQDGGGSWSETNITSLPVNMAPTDILCVGPYLVVISQADKALNYALTADVLAGTATWTRIATGFNASGGPNRAYSFSRTATWYVGQGGYIYKSTDASSGVVAQTSGDVTAQNLNDISGIDDLTLMAVGAANAILLTRNGGISWAAITGPSSQAAVAATTCAMVSDLEFSVGYADGTLFFTIDGGLNWTQKVLPGSPTVVDMVRFSTRTVGYIAAHTATTAKLYRTINGGASWYVLPETAGQSVPTALQWNAIAACGEDPNLIYAAGIKTAGGDGVLAKGA